MLGWQETYMKAVFVAVWFFNATTTYLTQTYVIRMYGTWATTTYTYLHVQFGWETASPTAHKKIIKRFWNVDSLDKYMVGKYLRLNY